MVYIRNLASGYFYKLENIHIKTEKPIRHSGYCYIITNGSTINRMLGSNLSIKSSMGIGLLNESIFELWNKDSLIGLVKSEPSKAHVQLIICVNELLKLDISIFFDMYTTGDRVLTSTITDKLVSVDSNIIYTSKPFDNVEEYNDYLRLKNLIEFTNREYSSNKNKINEIKDDMEKNNKTLLESLLNSLNIVKISTIDYTVFKNKKDNNIKSKKYRKFKDKPNDDPLIDYMFNLVSDKLDLYAKFTKEPVKENSKNQSEIPNCYKVWVKHPSTNNTDCFIIFNNKYYKDDLTIRELKIIYKKDAPIKSNITEIKKFLIDNVRFYIKSNHKESSEIFGKKDTKLIFSKKTDIKGKKIGYKAESIRLNIKCKKDDISRDLVLLKCDNLKLTFCLSDLEIKPLNINQHAFKKVMIKPEYAKKVIIKNNKGLSVPNKTICEVLSYNKKNNTFGLDKLDTNIPSVYRQASFFAKTKQVKIIE